MFAKWGATYMRTTVVGAKMLVGGELGDKYLFGITRWREGRCVVCMYVDMLTIWPCPGCQDDGWWLLDGWELPPWRYIK